MEPPPRRRRRIPGWVKISAIVVAVVLIAVGNIAAKKSQQRAKLAADRGAVSTLTSASVHNVTSSRYTVRFRMQLLNRSGRSVVLRNLTSPGLSMSVMGGLPLALTPHGTVDLAVAAALPACFRLPPRAQSGRNGAPQFGAMVLELRADAGADQTQTYRPNADLLAALVALRGRICP